MNEALAALLTEARGFLAGAFFVFLRVGGVMALMPAFGERLIPARVRLVLTFAFTLIVSAGLEPAVTAGLGPLSFGLLGEAVIGLMIGLMLRLFVLALQTAGAIIAQSISLSQMFGGTDGQPQPAVGNMLLLAGLAAAVHLGLHVKLASLMIESYAAMPPGRLPDADLVRAWGLSGVRSTFSLGFSIAMPFVLAGLIYNVALGAINRAMPQLMVSFVGAPALTFGGLVLLAIALPTGVMLWIGQFEAFLASPFQVRP
ncbi:flagellar biosynthetic protein FliR [Paenirhodobacter sp.]|uniref:flagellar biosynthetic protein FliR n=1 Tax=Paenirhodobacter sp. TaxID=1965326 RepID=UPI003B41FC67